MSELYVVIMAGGGGARLWPASTYTTPKQFLDLTGNGCSLLQTTFARALLLAPASHIVVVTAETYCDLVHEQLPKLPRENILGEPKKRNTAPCLTWASIWIAHRSKNATMLVLSSDHYIPDTEAFVRCIAQASEFCTQHPEALITFGIVPTRPETGYGYIETPYNKDSMGEIDKVLAFKEKPDRETATSYLNTGKFLWNSGIFVWKQRALTNALKRYLPKVWETFIPITTNPLDREVLERIYSRCNTISIDSGVLERSQDVYVLRVDFEWSDLGTWTAIAKYMQHDPYNNATTTETLFPREAKNNIVYSDSGDCVALLGVSDLIVAWHGDSLLICKKELEQEIRELVKDLEQEHSDKI